MFGPGSRILSLSIYRRMVSLGISRAIWTAHRLRHLPTLTPRRTPPSSTPLLISSQQIQFHLSITIAALAAPQWSYNIASLVSRFHLNAIHTPLSQYQLLFHILASRKYSLMWIRLRCRKETYYSDSFSWICLFQQQTMWYYLRSLCINEKPRQRHTDWFINLWYDSVIWYNFIAYTSMKMHQHNLKKPRDLPLHWRRRRAKTTTRMVYWTCGRKNYHLDNWISDWKPLDEISFQFMCQDNLKTWIVIYDYAGILFYE